MFFKKKFPFFIDAGLPVVLWLTLNVANRRWNLRCANAERAITFLPIETAAPGLLMNPLGRAGLHKLNCFGNRDGRWKRQKNMGVVCNSAD